MRGEFIGVWPETWGGIWLPLVDPDRPEEKDDPDEEGVAADIFCELFRSLAPSLAKKLSVEELADIIDDPIQSREAFERITPGQFAGERSVVEFLERVYEALEDFGGDRLSNSFFNLLSEFVERFNLRYDLRRPCWLCPTLSGVFSSLINDLKRMTSADKHLDGLMKDFEDAIRDLHSDRSDRRVRTCIQKQISLLEAIGSRCPGVSGNTLGAICNQVGTWPHERVKEAMKSLYSFASDYPGIRHGGTPASALRTIEMRDMVAISVVLAGFTPYLSDQLDADAVYRRV